MEKVEAENLKKCCARTVRMFTRGGSKLIDLETIVNSEKVGLINCRDLINAI